MRLLRRGNRRAPARAEGARGGARLVYSVGPDGVQGFAVPHHGAPLRRTLPPGHVLRRVRGWWRLWYVLAVPDGRGLVQRMRVHVAHGLWLLVSVRGHLAYRGR